MRKHIAVVIILSLISFVFSSCKINSKPQTETVIPKTDESEFIKAVWLNYNELAMKNEPDKSEKAFREKIQTVINNCADNGFNRIIFQVRPFCDAFYNSSVFPASAYLSGVQGAYIGYDALEIAVEYAKQRNIKIDAWINPFRAAYDTDTAKLSEDNPAKKWLENESTQRNVIILDNGIYLNPAKSEVQKTVLDGVREILENYKVDGIHIDDYFYPTADESFDLTEYNEYLQSGGVLSQADWRRENINTLVSQIYSTVKSYGEKLLFSVSPGGNIDKNINSYYADVKLWCSEEGYIDVIMPQLYYGFDNEKMPFEKVFNEWVSIKTADSVRLCIGLAFYKYTKEDLYAGTGINEWIENNDIISRQIELIADSESCDGFALYSYSYVFSEKLREFCNNELQIIKNMI